MRSIKRRAVGLTSKGGSWRIRIKRLTSSGQHSLENESVVKNEYERMYEIKEMLSKMSMAGSSRIEECGRNWWREEEFLLSHDVGTFAEQETTEGVCKIFSESKEVVSYYRWKGDRQLLCVEMRQFDVLLGGERA